MLTMGIPTNALMALMIGALMIHGIQPGPMVIQKQPELFWGLVASMWVGNLMLLVINLPLIHVWVALLKTPYRLMFPAIIMFCCVGSYASINSVFSVWLMLGWGLAGYFFKKIEVQPAPMILGFVLGPMLEENFRRAMQIANGNPAIFIERPISAVFLAAALCCVVALLLPAFRGKREMLKEDD